MWLRLTNEFELVKHRAEKLFTGELNASDAGILYISTITINLDEIEKGLKGEVEESINEFMSLDEEDKSIENLVNIYRESAKNKLAKLNQVKDFKKKWNTYWVDALAYA